MSRYAKRPIDFAGLKTVSLHARGGKVKVADFAAPYRKGSGIAGLLDGLPHILVGDSFRAVVDALSVARERGRAIVWGLGGHVIKCGLAPTLIDLGPEGGEAGGEVIAAGPPEVISASPRSATGHFLAPMLAGGASEMAAS